MKTTMRFAFAVLAVLFAGVGFARAESVSAKVVKVTGNVSYQVAGQSEQIATVGSSLPQGATITTHSGEAVVQTQDGTLVTLKPGSSVDIEALSVERSGGKVTKQTTLVNLRAGNIVATLDPTKKAVNDFKVRTPRGVAAARGTSFNIKLVDGSVTVTATADTVVFSIPGGANYEVAAGKVRVLTPDGAPSDPIPLAQAAASNPALAQAAADAVEAVSFAIQQGLVSSSGATNLASQIVAVASAVTPSSAASSAAQVATAIATTTSTEIKAAAASTVAAVTAAAVTAAPAEVTNIATSVATAAPAQAGAVVAAVSQVSPGSTSSVTEAVAKSTNQSTQAVSNAADSASSSASSGVNQANQATQNVVNSTTSTTPAPTSTTDTGTTTPPVVIDTTKRSASS